MAHVGIPLFYLQELRGIMMQFRDNFSDQSLYWAWATDEVSPPNRTIEELASGKLLINVNAGTSAIWHSGPGYNNAPKIVMGGGSFPLEIITKMESVSLGLNTRAGLYISGNPGGLGSNMMIVREVNDYPMDGLKVAFNETEVRYSQGDILDDPIFLRIRIGNWTYDRKTIIFGYSSNGVNWIDVHEETGSDFSDTWNMGVGLFVANDTENRGTFAGVSAQFDYFKMRTKSININ